HHISPSTSCLLTPAPPPTPPYTLSLHDALPISHPVQRRGLRRRRTGRAAARAEDRERRAWRHLDDRQYPARDGVRRPLRGAAPLDRKSTRLNSSHLGISYAVFCLKKKKA